MGQAKRDEFSSSTKKLLAERVGYCCSNPECRRKTVGPNSNTRKSSSIGEAAHIHAAAPNGPRHDPSMTQDKRSSAENGIWLCKTCARLIDVDTGKYTAELLHEWKRKAEDAAEKEISTRGKKNGNNRKRSIQIAAILIITILIAIVCIALIFNKRHDNQLEEITRLISDGSKDQFAATVDIPLVKEIAAEDADVSYHAGMESYRTHQYGTAAKQFEEAVNAQKLKTGAESTEVGRIYCMLGLSRIYAKHAIEDNGEDAVSVLNKALSIFQQNGETLDLAKCYFYLAEACFEDETAQYNRTIDYIKKSLEALGEYMPDISYLEYIADTADTQEPALMRWFTDPDDYEALYKACNYFELLQRNSDLMGKTAFMSQNYSSALYYFNHALENNSLLLDADYALATCDFSDKITIENHEIKEYLEGKTIGSILNDSVQIKVYSANKETGQIDHEEYTLEMIYRSADTATFLTNRAMCELHFENYEIASEDCLIAVDIWNEMPSFPARTNISYSYNYLAISQLGLSTASDNPESYLKERKDELQYYVNSALTYDIDFFGEENIRTAFSYEIRGLVNYMIGEPEIASESYKLAIDIYQKLGRKTEAQVCQKQVETIASDPYPFSQP